MIKAKSITKIYIKGGSAEICALKDVSVEIQKREFVSIMGASGSGKSTLMNIIGCLDKPTSGTFMLEGIDVNKLDDEALAKLRNKKIGFVFQSFNLLPRTNSLENVELPLIYSDKENITRLSSQALETVGLKDRMHHFPNELSGGQQQRVAIARAIVNDPEIIFADEPTGNLDTRAGLEIMSLFQKLNKQGRTIVLVTHESHIAQHANRIINISDGKVVSDEIMSHPRNAEEELKTVISTDENNEKD